MTRSIYLVDDDDAGRSSLHLLLSLQPGIAVHSFGSIDHFLAQAHTLDSGVVLLDLSLPGTDGIAVLHRLRQLGSMRFRPIMLAEDGNIALAVQAMKAGAADFIEKPCQADQLLATIDDAFASLIEEDYAAAQARQAQELIAGLSPRERDVLIGLIDGQGNKVIAHRLDISPRTMEIYRANLMMKLGVRSLSEALRIAFAAGIDPAASA